MIDVSSHSNIDDVGAWVQGLVDSWNFSLPGEDQSLGRDMAGDVASGISERMTGRKTMIDGSPIEANEPKYATRKAKQYGLSQYDPAIRTGQMTSEASTLGDVTAQPAAVEMRYGTGQAPTSSSAGLGYISKQDEAITDTEKAVYNSDRFEYAMDDEIVQAVFDRAVEHLTKHLETSGKG